MNTFIPFALNIYSCMSDNLNLPWLQYRKLCGSITVKYIYDFCELLEYEWIQSIIKEKLNTYINSTEAMKSLENQVTEVSCLVRILFCPISRSRDILRSFLEC